MPFRAPPCGPGFTVIEILGAGRRCVARSACPLSRDECRDQQGCSPCSPSGERYAWEPETGLLHSAKRGEWMDAMCRRSVDGITPAEGAWGMPEYFGICTWASPCPSPSPSAPPTGCVPGKLIKVKGGSSGYGKWESLGGRRVSGRVTFTFIFADGPCEPGRPGWATTCCGREQDDPNAVLVTYETRGDVTVTWDPNNPFNAGVEGEIGSVVRWHVCPRDPRMRRKVACETEWKDCDNSRANQEWAGEHEESACTDAVLTLPEAAQ